MHTVLGDSIVATLPAVGPPPTYGARIEIPVTREIVSAWTPGVLTDATATVDAFWTVTLESPGAGGDYCIVWVTQEAEEEGWPDQFVPLFVEAA